MVIGEIAKGASLPIALRRLHDVSNSRLEIMALMYDLDGALHAGQIGLARYTAISLLDASVTLWLRERSIEAPAFEHIPARARASLSLLAAVNSDLSERVSALYRTELPADATASDVYWRAVIDMAGELTGYGSAGLAVTTSRWADLAYSVRAICGRLGMPLNDFYWAPPDAETWHSDAQRFAAVQACHDDAGDK